MGLDMYLTKKIYIGANYEHRSVTGKIELFSEGEPISINLNRVSTITEEVGYWRKANAIHGWFVKNVMDGKDECRDFYVMREELATLLSLCKEVKKDHTVARYLLPSQEGFFFGSTEYDEWYFKDIDNTIDILTPIVEGNESGDYYYYPSW